MTTSPFFNKHGPFALNDLAKATNVTLAQPNQGHLMIHDVTPLQDAGSGHLTFYHNTKYRDALARSAATACLIHPDHAASAPPHMALLLTSKPYRAYAHILGLFYTDPEPDTQISPLASIHPSAIVGENVSVGPFCVIRENVLIGANTVIGSHTVIERGVIIGNHCTLAAHVTISHATIGNHVLIKTGARIGQKGFGFDMDDAGHISVPQIGQVVIGDHVEIGANTTIDRGSAHNTIIGAGTRIDNLVQIAHNVVLGEQCVIVAQVGIAGSTKLGRFVIAAGQAGIAGHLEIGDFARIAAQSGLMKNVDARQTVAGCPAIPVRDWHKQTIALAKLIKKGNKDDLR